MGEVARLIGILLCIVLEVVLLLCIVETLKLLVRIACSPRKYRTAHMAHADLYNAVRSMNRGTATDVQKRMIEDALRVGMVNTGFSVEDAALRMHYYKTDYAYEMWWAGEYPTRASIDAELEVFRIS